MSVIIELLKQHSADKATRDNSSDKVREYLAETYLQPSSIKTEPVAPKPGRKNRYLSIILPVLLLGSLAISFYIFSTQIFYKNLLYTQRIELFGSSFSKNTLMHREVFLIDNGASDRAGIIISFKKPIDFSDKYLLVSAGAKIGENDIRVVFRDKNYRSFIPGIISVKNLKNKKQSFVISTENYKDSIDIRNILQIRLESVDNALQDRGGSIIYIKKIGLIGE